LKSVVVKFEITAKNKHQKLEVITGRSSELFANVDKDGIEQVLVNILSNAIKYTEDGGRIEAEAYEENQTAKLVISDNGIGIPRQELPRVFERFFRVDKARSRAMGGTGFGLAICKQIVEDHGGSIGIESEEGRGTKVTISLPMTRLRGSRGIE